MPIFPQHYKNYTGQNRKLALGPGSVIPGRVFYSGSTFESSPGQTVFGWNAPSNPGPPITDYYIDYSNSYAGPYVPFAHTPRNVPNQTITGLTNGAYTYFRVAAINANGRGPLISNDYMQTMAGQIPAAPTPFTATVASASQVTLNWVAPAVTIPAYNGYLVFYKASASSTWISLGFVQALTLTVSNLTTGTAYDFRVQAYNPVVSSSGTLYNYATATNVTPIGLAAGTYNLPLTNNSGGAYSYAYDEPYGNIRAGTGLATVGAQAISSTNTLYIGQRFESGKSSSFQLDEGLFEFDTKLGTGTSITSATLKIFVQADNSITDFILEAYAYDYGTIDGSNYIPGGSLPPGGAALAASISTSPSLNGLVNLTNSGTVLRSACSTTGKTKLVLASNRLRLNNEPTSYEYLFLRPFSCILTVTVT